MLKTCGAEWWSLSERKKKEIGKITVDHAVLATDTTLQVLPQQKMERKDRSI